MLSFQSFLNEAAHPGARTGLPHLGDLSAEDLMKVTRGGKVNLSHSTHKTDGSAVEVSWHPKHGLTTRHSGIKSEHGVKNSSEYFDHTKARAEANGREPDYTGARGFAAFHDSLSRNKKFLEHAKKHYEKHGSFTMKGELFSPHMSRPSENHPGEMEHVSTPVHSKHMGNHGLFVIHSRLPQNKHHDAESISRLSDHNLKFDHDVPEIHPHHSHVDVSDEHEELKNVDHKLASSRITPSNKEAVRNERAKIADIGSRVYKKVRNHAQKHGLFKNKWGSGHGEGLVVHHSDTRFKITSPRFADEVEKKKKEGREATAQKLFGRGNDNPTRIDVSEGGNIKVKGGEGIKPDPIPTDSRESKRADFHEMLGSVHDEMHKHTGEHLFGKAKISLRSGKAFSGSTEHYMKNTKPLPKKSMGDFDTLIAKEHVAHLEKHVLHPGKKHGKFTVVGTKKHGTQISAIMKHEDGSHHQVDFAGLPSGQHHEGVPTEGARFLHSSSLEDARRGFKGKHHKILLSAVAHHSGKKFNSVYGMHDHNEHDSKEQLDQKRKNAKTEPASISHALFGSKAEHGKIHSFVGTSELIRDHIPKHKHQAIYDKFKEGLADRKGNVPTEHHASLKHLRDTLGNVKDAEQVSESRSKDSHAYVSPMMGASPHTHLGHIQDVEGTIRNLKRKHGEGKAIIGLSGKSNVFSDLEREAIAHKQSAGGVEYKVHPTAGRAITTAVKSMSGKTGKKHLHIVVGSDRREMAEKLRDSIKAGKIRDKDDNPIPIPDHIHIHTPEDGNRSHGMSGTKMRKAASEGNLEEYHRHLGPNFTRSEASHLMSRTRKALSAGSISINRKR